ncbi:hypothetical protein [Nocardiopsis nanhaiensis]
MIVVTVVLTTFALLKLIAVIGAIRWMYTRGSGYVADLVASPPHSTAELHRSYDRNGGAFLPFGVKDYRLRRWADRLARRGHRLAAGALSGVRALFFSLPVQVVVAAVYVAAIASAPQQPESALRAWNDSLALGLCFLLVATTMLLAAEAVVAYAVLGSYGVSFHSALPVRQSRAQVMIQEFRVFVGAAVFAHLASATAMYLISVRFGGYQHISGPVAGIEQALGRGLDVYYHTLMVFIGGGEPGPLTPVGQVATGLIAAQGLSLLLLVLATMLTVVPGRADTEGGERAPEHEGPKPRGGAPLPFAAGVAGSVVLAAAVTWLVRRFRSGRPGKPE